MNRMNPSTESIYWEETPFGHESSSIGHWRFSADTAPAKPIRVLPDGALSVLFSAPLDGQGWEASVLGATTRPFFAYQPEARIQIQVCLVPGFGRPLLGGLRDLRDQAIALEELWGPAGRLLLSKLSEERSWAGRRRLLAETILQPDEAVDQKARLTRYATQLIRSDQGRSRISKIARLCGVGPRQLERAFRDHLGISPKLYARIIRFRTTHEKLHPTKNYADVAIEFGYSDHAHLTREFQCFAGQPPSTIDRPRPSKAKAAASPIESFERRVIS